MADLRYGFVEGEQILVPMKVDSSTTAIAVGDFVSLATAGYIKVAAAGDKQVGIAQDAVITADIPGSDGALTIMVDISQTAIYRYPPDTGTVTQALVGLTCDLGGARSLDIDASADDCVRIVRVDTATNELYVQQILVSAGVA